MSVSGMSLSGWSEEALPSRKIGRSVSAKELRSELFDSSRVSDTVFRRDNSSEPTRAKDMRRKAELSPSMRSGDSMREAMTHEPPWIAALRHPRRSPRGSPRDSPVDSPSRAGSAAGSSVRRWRSCEPSSLADLRDSECSSPKSNYHTVCAATLRDHSADFFNRSRLDRDISSPTRRSENGDGSVKRSEYGDSSYRFNSPGGRDSHSVRSVASTYSPYNPRAKPGSAASEMSRSTITARSPHSHYSSAAAEDHLWRELFHQEADDRKVARLRGDGKVIGERNKASKGIPWRQIPDYDAGGRFSGSGDPHSSRRSIVKASRMTEKRRGQCSPRLDQSYGVMDLLSTVSENCENRPPPVKQDSEAREAWLDVVKRRRELQRKRSPRPNRPAEEHHVPNSSPCRTSPRDKLIEMHRDGSAEDMHHHWRQLRHTPKKTNGSRGDIKDACPYTREDSKLVSVPPRPLRSPVPQRSPENFRGGNPQEALCEGEKVIEARRDWQLSQEKFDRDDSIYSQDSMCRSPGGRSQLSRSSSAHCFSASTLLAAASQVHSVRSRPEAAQRPRWK